jgi:SAM-dependent methyltransferase
VGSAPEVAYPGGQAYGASEAASGHLRSMLRTEGWAGTFVRAATYPPMPWIRFGWGPSVRLARRLSGATTFPFEGERLAYAPALGERTIEIPIAERFVARAPSGSSGLLEIGNVLNHHRRFPHAVVDKYEPGDGVLNADVVDYEPPERFGAIVSVSTLEHVGWDERPRDPPKLRAALRHLVERCLRPGGELLATVPLGYNPEVDALVRDPPPEVVALDVYRRQGARNLWEPVARGERLGYLGELPPYSFRRHRPERLAVVRWRAPLASG